MESENGYRGPAPVSLADYSHMMRLQAGSSRPRFYRNRARRF